MASAALVAEAEFHRAAFGTPEGIERSHPWGEVLVAAYDDPLGVTAAFNKNLLVRLNRELGANFNLDDFAHRAVWDAAESRVEMHLESLRAQRVSNPGSGCEVVFAAASRSGPRVRISMRKSGSSRWVPISGWPVTTSGWTRRRASPSRRSTRSSSARGTMAHRFRPGSSPS